MPEDMTPKPTIDPDSPVASRGKDGLKRMPKSDSRVRIRACYIVNKFRNRQRALLDCDDITDPDPFVPTYLFYCFQGKLVD